MKKVDDYICDKIKANLCQLSAGGITARGLLIYYAAFEPGAWNILCFTLLTHEGSHREVYWEFQPSYGIFQRVVQGSHREVYRDFQPSLTSFEGGAKG